ncbi:hypothetical protein [Ottowia sp.]|uniref:hypothetical protein n=1 Tax=Ottowia sp. TaxID=1898956 RepID=UPI0025CEDB7C|nr:hypothetical protein [Ottowia sp.]MBK6616361.1 hypothetical protein [Ottowia sp.]
MTQPTPNSLVVLPSVLRLLVEGTMAWLSEASTISTPHQEAVKTANRLLLHCPPLVNDVPLERNAGYMHKDGYPVVARHSEANGWYFEAIGMHGRREDITQLTRRIESISDVPESSQQTG